MSKFSLWLFAGAYIFFAGHAGTALAEGDAVVGEKLFKKCSTCHTVGSDAKHKQGPILNGVIGRVAGSLEEFKYGKSIKAAGESGLVWDEDLIFDYLANPKKFLGAYLGNKKAKSKMNFKLKKEDDRRNLIAYLATFSPE